jgi:hypothetical protein
MRGGWSPENIIISGPLENNGAIPVNIQDQTSKALDLDFIQAQGSPTTLSVIAAAGDTQLTLTDATGFVDGNVVGILSGGAGLFYFGTQIGAPVGNVITIDTPIDQSFAIGSTVIRASAAMNVNGSLASPQIFQIGPIGTAIEVDIVRISGYIQAGSAMDLSDFGDIAGGLTNGIVFRKSNGTNENLWNAKTNGRLKLITGIDLDFTTRAPGGSEGMNFRATYGGQNKHGVVLRLEASETLEILVQDNLTTLQAFNMMAQGHIVTD